jgi:hypothetical protein
VGPHHTGRRGGPTDVDGVAASEVPRESASIRFAVLQEGIAARTATTNRLVWRTHESAMVRFAYDQIDQARAELNAVAKEMTYEGLKFVSSEVAR